MNQIKLFCLVLLLTFIAIGCESKPAKSLHDAVGDKDTAELLTAEKMAAIAEIEKLGGTIKVDANSPNKPVTAVYFVGPITDADLVHLKGMTNLKVLGLSRTKVTGPGLEHLEGLNRLYWLVLSGTQISDAGLEQLKGLTKLRILWLNWTQITDDGLVHLQGLPRLAQLHLYGTQITDAGLEHLKGLTGLQKLSLGDTQVTDAGVKDLQNALPNLQISR